MGYLVPLIGRLFNVYEVLIVAYCLMSWVPRTGSGLFEDIRGALGILVEPYLGFFRRFIPPLGGIDFSPVVAILVLGVLERLLYTIIL
ncbi:YggT family protein [Olsenella sp. An290]|uniref:YggT family protein n=1 Tax=Olsenella sp. An290 TaxID=1965625 RepID=UPI000B3735CD|nr:YggT family protein [Olsenella sp. An290]OUO34532.1 YggT family protein [Olsenella sp. An290]